jgi:hypothetical protein
MNQRPTSVLERPKALRSHFADWCCRAAPLRRAHLSTLAQSTRGNSPKDKMRFLFLVQKCKFPGTRRKERKFFAKLFLNAPKKIGGFGPPFSPYLAPRDGFRRLSRLEEIPAFQASRLSSSSGTLSMFSRASGGAGVRYVLRSSICGSRRCRRLSRGFTPLRPPARGRTG